MSHIFKWNGVEYTIDKPNDDQILKYGIVVPYVQSSNAEEKVVIDEYIFWSARLQSPIVIPVWFLTDLASIPKVFRTIVSKAGKTEIPSLPHDFGYAINGCQQPSTPTVSRKEWDGVLLDFCKQQEMGWVKRTLVYTAVRAGGYFAFKSEGDMFIPKVHRKFYIQRWPKLSLSEDVGDYIVL